MYHDLRFALRQLVKHRTFTLIAVLALGIGIGQAASTFNAFSAILLRPIPHVQDEDHVVFLDQIQLKNPDNSLSFSLPDYLDVRAQTQTLDGLTIVSNRTFILGGGTQPERALGSSISAAAFGMLGVQPLRGRLFRPDEELPGAAPVAILSEGLWKRRFGSSDDIIGKTTMLNGAQVMVVGVMPAGFRFPETSEIWTPFTFEVKDYPRDSHSFPVYGRLKPGVSLDQAQAELATLSARLAAQYKESNDGVGFTARLIRDEATLDVVVLMRLMLGAVLFVLLIACANVANLLLAKSVTRANEIAIRTALGATRGRIIRQVLTESLLLGLLGGAAGLLFAAWNNAYMISAIPVELPFWINFDFDWRVFAFTSVVTVGSAMVFGLFPALQVSRSTALELKEGGRGGTGSPRAHRLRQLLVVSQIALALVLLIGAGLMVRSFINLQSTNPGFDPHGVITFRVGLPPTQYKDKAQIRRFFEQLTSRLATMPGVEFAGATTMLPGSGMNVGAFSIDGQPKPKTLMEAPFAVQRTVTTGYFQAMGITLLRGRNFTADDTADKPRVLIVDQGFVDRWFPGKDVLGQRVSFDDNDGVPIWVTIVGIVSTVPQRIGTDAPKFGVYSAVAQENVNFLSYALRVKGDPTTYQAAIQRTVSSVMAEIPIYNVQTMERALAVSYWQKKFFGRIFTNYGIVALFLASLGIYGVMTYSVSQRTQEIGVRMALGAQPSDVLRLIGRQGFLLVSLGIGLGLAAALGLTRFMAGFLYGVSPSDPPTYFALSSVLAVVAFIACWLPVRRATRVDPVTALRAE